MALVEQGITPWFYEWGIRLGDSLTREIERGLGESEVFVLVWSVAASNSNWVDTELRAFLQRKVREPHLRIVPVMVDDTPLPILVADFKGIAMTDEAMLG